MRKDETLGLTVVAAVVVAGIFLSLGWPDLLSPSQGLVNWTKWVGSVVTIVVATRIFWAGGTKLREWNGRKVD